MNNQISLFDNKELDKDICYQEVKKLYPQFDRKRIEYAIKSAGFIFWQTKEDKPIFFSRVRHFILNVYKRKFEETQSSKVFKPKLYFESISYNCYSLLLNFTK